MILLPSNPFTMTDSALTEAPAETAEAPETTETATVPRLVGKELLAAIRDLGPNCPKDEIARATGYASTKVSDDGEVVERFAYAALYEATLEAKGVAFAPASSGGAGRKASFEAVVQKSGNLTISKAYTADHGAEPGHVFKITLLPDGGFQLTPLMEEPAA